MRRTLKISVELLPAEIRSSFEAIFNVCRTRSVTAWEIRPAQESDLVCCVPSHAEQSLGLRRNQMKLWFAHRSDVDSLMTDGDLSIAPADMRVVTVLGAIDMAALRLMDSSIYTHLNDSPSVLARRGGSEAAPPEKHPTTRYTLTHWPKLTGKFAERTYLNAAGMMTKRAVTMDYLSRLTGLSADSVSAFINELSRLRALKIVNADVAAAKQSGYDLGRAVDRSRAVLPVPRKSGFLGRIRAWLASSPA